MRRLVGCVCFVLLLVVPVSFEYTGQRQVFNLYQKDQEKKFEERLVSHPQREDIVLYHAMGNIFHRTFDEPFESIVFVTWRGTVAVYTNQLVSKVGAPVEVIRMDLRPTGEDLTDVILVVHNHFGYPFFSSQGKQNDMKYYAYLKRNGFNGVFALWDTALNKMVRRLPPKK